MSYAENIEILNEEAARTGASSSTLAFLKNTMHAESGGNTYAAASNSSAKGIFQVIDSTWRSVCKQIGADASKRFDPRTQCQVAIAYAEENAKVLRGVLGHEPTAGDLYIGHFLGTGGAKRALSASASTPLSEVMTPGALSANASIKFRGKALRNWTVGDLQDWADAKMNVDLGAREDYQRRHDLHQTSAEEDSKEMAQRRRILSDFGMSNENIDAMGGSILDKIFIGILKAILDVSATPAERNAAQGSNVENQNTIQRPDVPSKPKQLENTK